MVLPDSDGISRVPPYSGSTPEETLFRLQGCYLLRRTFPGPSSKVFLCNSRKSVLQPQRDMLFGLGCFRFARRYSGNRICFLFLQVLRCFSSLGMPRQSYVFRLTYCSITNSGFPHSEIPGSQFTYNSPRHIGVSPVLHRLLVPRHPPCALIHLTSFTVNKHALIYYNPASANNRFSFLYLMSLLLLFSFQGTIKRDLLSQN